MSATVVIRHDCASQDESAQLYERLRTLFANNLNVTVHGKYIQSFEHEEPTDDAEGPSEP